MNEPAVLAVVVNLVALAVHAGLGFYWAGRIVGRLDLLVHRVGMLEARAEASDEALEDHRREHRAGIWGAP